MSPKRTLATSSRVLRQLSHDHRAIGLILFVPTLLMIILRFVFDGDVRLFNHIAPIILGIFPFTVMFIITSITMLRERTTGTLERLMTLPIAKLDLLLGYGLAFGVLAACQASLASFVTFYWLDTGISGSVALIVVVALLAGLLGMSLGLFVSAFARTEFQAVQFMPAFVLPMLLVSGLFVPHESMTTLLQWFADITPLAYVVSAMQEVSVGSEWTAELTTDISVILGFTIGALILGAATLRRNS